MQRHLFFTSSIEQIFIEHLLYVLLGIKDAAVIKTAKSLCSHGIYIIVKGIEQ